MQLVVEHLHLVVEKHDQGQHVARKEKDKPKIKKKDHTGGTD